MKRIHRRRFLQASSAAGVALAASPALSAPALSLDSPSKKYRTAIIGTGWWGMNILGEAMASGESRVVGLCDVDEAALSGAREVVGRRIGDSPKAYKDYRDMIEAERPEIVIVATPDHWHPLNTIDAVAAGAHVYVEKPISHTIREGRAMVKAARDAGRVVQVGTHRRVSPHNVSGREFLRGGKAGGGGTAGGGAKMGKIGMVRAFVHYGGGPESPEPNSEPPAGLDWDLWCGPAPLRPFNRRIHPKGFRQFLDYGNGTLGDWGIHWMDQILWWTEETYPKKISAAGGRFIKGPPVNGPEGQTTDAPDCLVVAFEFDGFVATWEHRQFAGNEAEKANVGCYFYGTGGTFHMGWLDGWTFYPAGRGGEAIHEEPRLHDPDKQNIKELWADFLQAIKTGRRPVCDIEIGHRSTCMSLLGMLAWRLGRSIRWDGEKETIVGDDEANRLLARPYRGAWKYPG